MTERAYTVAEIDALRQAHRDKYLFGTFRPVGAGGRTSRIYREQEVAVLVEQQVRTSMLAGHTAEDLRQSET